MTSIVKKTPHPFSIERDPLWVNVPREVGDGMEAQRSSSSLSISSTTTSTNYTTSCAATTVSFPEKIPFQIINEQQASSPYPEIAALPSSSSLNQSAITFSDSEKFLIEEKAALKDHLEIQIQVNQEIKKLLVASVGDDISYHYERLSTEKSQLTKEIDDLKAQLDAKKEELERFEISCDIWRSKFLASRMQCDDALEWRRVHERQTRELESATRGLLRQHWIQSEHLEHILASLCMLDTSLNGGHLAAEIKDPTASVAEKCRRLGNGLAQTLLDSNDKASSKPISTVALNRSPAEKYVLQVLGDIQRVPSIRNKREGSTLVNEVNLSRGVASHLRSIPGSATLNCCSHCKGDIFVV